MKKLETFVNSLADKLEKTIKKNGTLHGILYMEHDAKLLLYILIGSILMSLFFTLL